MHLRDIPKQITDAIAKVKAYPTTQIQKALNAIVDKAKSYLALSAGGKAPNGLIDSIISFAVNGEQHQLWVANQNGQAVLMRASQPIPRFKAADLIKNLPGWQLATQEQLDRIQGFIDRITTVGASIISIQKQIEAWKDSTTNVLAKAPPGTTSPVPGLLSQLIKQEKQLDSLEKQVIEELIKDLKVMYTPANEPAVPNKNWDDYLTGLGKDALGKTFPGNPWSSGKGKGTATHAHHIVIKEGGPAVADESWLARQLLWEVGINPYTAQENLVWAPNWSHSKNYARDVLAELLAVRGNKKEITKVLKDIARRFMAGEWSTK